MKKLLIIGNWKMNIISFCSARKLYNSIARGMPNIRNSEVVICAPFLYLQHLKKSRTRKIIMGAQNCFWEQKGRYTGEISPKMLKDFGCKYVIVGHSERREYLKESDSIVNKKLLSCADANLPIVLCIGEKRGERINTILPAQLQRGLRRFPLHKIYLLNIAYEPLWAISPGTPCRPDNALVAKMLIRKTLFEIFKKRSLAQSVRILYGGSINSKNAFSYIEEAQMHGFIVGSESLDFNEFIAIAKNVSSARIPSN